MSMVSVLALTPRGVGRMLLARGVFFVQTVLMLQDTSGDDRGCRKQQ